MHLAHIPGLADLMFSCVYCIVLSHSRSPCCGLCFRLPAVAYDVKLIPCYFSLYSQTLKQQLCKAHEAIESLEGELREMDSKTKLKEEEIQTLKAKLCEKDEEIERVKEQRNVLAKGECESQLAFDIVYNEAVQERKDAIER